MNTKPIMQQGQVWLSARAIASFPPRHRGTRAWLDGLRQISWLVMATAAGL
jgi:hypothetical protein